MCHEGSELSLQSSAEGRHLFRDVYDYSFRSVHVYSFRDVRVYYIIGFSREQAFVQGCPYLFVYGCQCLLNYRVQQTADTCLGMSMFIRLGMSVFIIIIGVSTEQALVQGCPYVFVYECPCLLYYRVQQRADICLGVSRFYLIQL